MLLMTIAVVVDASAAFLRRQDLATLAEGAALQGADPAPRAARSTTAGSATAPLQLTVARPAPACAPTSPTSAPTATTPA